MKTAYEIALARCESFEAIPPITDLLGKNWNQPERSEILIDDTHALMTRFTFDKLAEYSASFPTGVYEGKMWKRHDGAFDTEYISRGGKPVWMLFWYGRHPDPDKVSNNYRTILVVD
jgi:hypothetical protein